MLIFPSLLLIIRVCGLLTWEYGWANRSFLNSFLRFPCVTAVYLRTIKMRDFEAEVARFKKIYNSAWEKNWGFVPLTDPEIDHIAAGLRQIVDHDIVVYAEKDGEPIGAMLPLPPVPPDVRWRKTVRLGRDHYVRVDTCDYSVHPRAIGARVEVERTLEWVAVRRGQEEVARHRRSLAPHRTITDPEHAAARRAQIELHI